MAMHVSDALDVIACSYTQWTLNHSTGLCPPYMTLHVSSVARLLPAPLLPLQLPTVSAVGVTTVYKLNSKEL